MNFTPLGVYHHFLVTAFEFLHSWNVVITHKAPQDVQPIFPLATGQSSELIPSADTKDCREDLADNIGKQGGFQWLVFHRISQNVGRVRFVIHNPIPARKVQRLLLALKFNFALDRQADDSYLKWCEQWITGCSRLLTVDGSLWVLICDEWADYFGLLLRKVGLHRRSWIKWCLGRRNLWRFPMSWQTSQNGQPFRCLHQPSFRKSIRRPEKSSGET